MCGFVIKISKEPEFTLGLLEHRGPDEQYVKKEHNLQIEYDRLAITGLIDGHSPTLSLNKRFSVFLNGEIYNFRELQTRFNLPKSNSDSITLANLVETHGIDAISHLRGMFAFAIFDELEKILYVARDPLGEKPLFFCNEKEDLVIASEFRAVLKILGGSIQLNQAAIEDYLRFNYVEEPKTFDFRISAFPKGALVKIDPNSRKITYIKSLNGYSESEIGCSLADLLNQVLHQTTKTEVASALSLSSGIDSTAILMRKMMHLDPNFSAITLHTGYDETASEVLDVKHHASMVGTPLSIVNTDETPFIGIVERFVDAMDQPICDPSSINYYLIFERAKALSKKVVFLGQGPDEFFWGYPHYYKALSEINSSPLSLSNRAFTDAPQKSTRLLACLSQVDVENERTLNSSDPFLKSSDKWQLFRANMVHGYLSHNGFAQIDRLSMHFSVEARSPLADSRLYGWAQLNSHEDSRAFEKMEFKNALSLGPLEHVKTKPKTGFRSDIESIISNELLSPLINDAYQRVFKSDAINWRFTYPKMLLSKNEKWKILVLGLWLQSLNDSL
jgi:asparagine synthase (glutamine-hydrolysing)